MEIMELGIFWLNSDGGDLEKGLVICRSVDMWICVPVDLWIFGSDIF